MAVLYSVSVGLCPVPRMRLCFHEANLFAVTSIYCFDILNHNHATDKNIYAKKFRREWKQKTEFNGWLSEMENDSSKAYCNVCNCTLTAKYSDLIFHSNAK